ncbi:MAG: ribonuclease P protein component [Parvularculaceae bacterium]|nr:ribonuclease P protein component [Parvularculaceae bacterium]
MENTERERTERALRLESLKKRRDFLAAQSGLRAHSPAFVLTRSKSANQSGETRVGFTVTRRIGNAVVRNRIKRRLRAAVGAVFSENAAAGFDYVLIARRSAATRNFASLLDDMKRVLLRLSALPK